MGAWLVLLLLLRGSSASQYLSEDSWLELDTFDKVGFPLAMPLDGTTFLLTGTTTDPTKSGRVLAVDVVHERYTVIPGTEGAVETAPMYPAHGRIGQEWFFWGGRHRLLDIYYEDLKIFDLDNYTWRVEATTNSPPVRYDVASCVIGTDLFVFGGYSPNAAGVAFSTKNTYILDSTTMVWSAHLDMPQFFAGGNAFEVGGKIYVLGGVTYTSLNMHRIFRLNNPGSGSASWDTLTISGGDDMSAYPNQRMGMVLVGNHIITMAGNGDGTCCAYSNDINVLDVVGEAWHKMSPSGTAPKGRASPGVALLSSVGTNPKVHTVVMLGGSYNEWADSFVAEVSIPTSGTPTAKWIAPSEYSTTVPQKLYEPMFAQKGSELFYFGGKDVSNVMQDHRSIYVLEYSTMQWSLKITGAHATTQRTRGACAFFGEVLVVFGGYAGSQISSPMYIDTSTWSPMPTWQNLPVTGTSPSAKDYATMVTFKDATSYFGVIYGGSETNSMSNAETTVLRYDLVGDTWTYEWPATSGYDVQDNYGHACTALKRKMYCMGGLSRRGAFGGSLYSQYVYALDVDEWRWYLLASDGPLHKFPVIATVGTNIYLMYGLNGDFGLDVVNVYDTLSDTWDLNADVKGVTPAPRDQLAIGVFGSVLVCVGGKDKSTGLWSATNVRLDTGVFSLDISMPTTEPLPAKAEMMCYLTGTCDSLTAALALTNQNVRSFGASFSDYGHVIRFGGTHTSSISIEQPVLLLGTDMCAAVGGLLTDEGTGVCCLKSCGICGGAGCGGRTGGSAGCCGSTIIAANVPCGAPPCMAVTAKATIDCSGGTSACVSVTTNANSPVTLSNIVVKGSNMSSLPEQASYGPAIRSVNSNIEMVEVDVIGGTAYSGGAMHFDLCDLSVVDSTVSGARAVHHGGGMYVTDSRVSMLRTTWSGCEATQGGAVFAIHSSFSIEATVFTGNTATNGAGGAVALTAESTADVRGTVGSGNTATGGVGGGFLSCASDRGFLGGLGVTIMGSNLTANYGVDGGALSSEGCPVLVANCVLESNSASSGGAVSVDGSFLEVFQSRLQGNTAESGGGAIEVARASATIELSRAEDNTAASGGAMHAFQSTFVTTSSSFRSNTASNRGGLSFFDNSVLSSAASPGLLACSANGALYLHHQRMRVLASAEWADTTVCMWVRPDPPAYADTRAVRGLRYLFHGGGAPGLDVHITIHGSMVARAGECSVASPAGRVHDNTWTHLAAVVSSSDNAIMLYINGVEVASGCRGFVSGRTLPTNAITCDSAADGTDLSLVCPANHYISGVTFVSFGNPTGMCGNFVQGGSHSGSASDLDACLGLEECVIEANTGNFGTPSGGGPHSLSVQVTCSPFASFGASGVEHETGTFEKGFVGYMDDIRVFDAVLTQREVARLMYAVPPATVANLQLFYPLDSDLHCDARGFMATNATLVGSHTSQRFVDLSAATCVSYALIPVTYGGTAGDTAEGNPECGSIASGPPAGCYKRWKPNSGSSHLQLDLGSVQSVDRLTVAASGSDQTCYTSSFVLKTSDDGSAWTDHGTFAGTRDFHIKVHHYVYKTARYFRLEPSSQADDVCLRVGVYSCAASKTIDRSAPSSICSSCGGDHCDMGVLATGNVASRWGNVNATDGVRLEVMDTPQGNMTSGAAVAFGERHFVLALKDEYDQRTITTVLPVTVVARAVYDVDDSDAVVEGAAVELIDGLADFNALQVIGLPGPYTIHFEVVYSDNTDGSASALPAQASVVLRNCTPGEHFKDARTCVPCAPGHYSTTYDAPVCQECGIETFQANLSATSCLPCPPGTHSPGTRSAICTPCDVNHFSPGGQACQRCVNSEALQTGSAKCNCIAGFVGDPPDCIACPKGADCAFRVARPLPGFWRNDNVSNVFYSCPLKEACKSDDTCLEGHSGVVCDVCWPGYKKSATMRCTKCPEAGTGLSFIAIIILVVVCIVFGALWMYLSSTLKASGLEWVVDALDDIKLAVLEARKLVGTHLKITIGFIQIISQLTAVYDVPWPNNFMEFSNFFTFVHLDIIDLSGIFCVASVNHYTSLMVYTISPLVFLLVIVLVYPVRVLFKTRSLKKDYKQKAGNDFALRDLDVTSDDGFVENVAMMPSEEELLDESSTDEEVVATKALPVSKDEARQQADEIVTKGKNLFSFGRNKAKEAQEKAHEMQQLAKESYDIALEVRDVAKDAKTAAQHALHAEAQLNEDISNGVVMLSEWSSYSAEDRPFLVDDDLEERTPFEEELRNYKRSAIDGHVRIALIFLILVYPGVCAKIFSTFNCREIEGVYYMEADIREICGEADWFKAAVYAAFMIVLYPVGVPALFAYLIYRNRKYILDTDMNLAAESFLAKRDRVAGRLGVLYETYDTNWDHPLTIYWETIELIRKLIFSALMMFVAKGSVMQVVVAVLLSCVFLLLHTYFRPFEDTWADTVQFTTLVQLSLTFFAGILLKLQAERDSDRLFLGILVIILNCSGAILSLVTIVTRIVVQVRAHRKRAQAIVARKVSNMSL